MRSSLQIRAYSSFNQVESDLNLLDNGISKVTRIIGSLAKLDNSKSIAKYNVCTEVAASLVSAIRNIQIWQETATATPATGIVSRIEKTSKKIEDVEKRLFDISNANANPTKELIEAAAKIKIYCDSKLIDNFDSSSSGSFLIMPVSSGSPFTIIQASYTNLIDSSSFRFPEFFINTAMIDGQMKLCMSCLRSIRATGEYIGFSSTAESRKLIDKKLRAFGFGGTDK